MSEQTKTGSPGSHPHSDRPNWQPGDDDADELIRQKIEDALRDGKGERHIAKLLGVSRMAFWRGRLLNAIPSGLLERLLAARVGLKAMLYISRLGCDPDNIPADEVERCPHCGHVLRVRNKSILRALDVMQQWVRDGSPGPVGGSKLWRRSCTVTSLTWSAENPAARTAAYLAME
jgi:hypothetical protein